MKTQEAIDRSSCRPTTWKVGICLLTLIGCLGQSGASTLVSGNISGTWSKTGSPYLVIANSTVQAGQGLSIQPGVTVIIGENLEIDVYGQIQAIGTAAEPIVIKGTSPTNRWSEIMVQYGGGPESEFHYCRFSDATWALHLNAYGATVSMQTVIANCAFSNCSDTAILGNAEATTDWYYTAYQPSIDCLINNCRFSNCANGCWFWTQGVSWSWLGVTHYGYSGANPNIANCIFESCINAIGVNSGDYPASSSPKIVNCLTGC